MKHYIAKKDQQRAIADRNRSTPLEDMLERKTQKQALLVFDLKEMDKDFQKTKAAHSMP